MPTPSNIALQASINSGPPTTGGIVANHGDTVDLSLVNTAGVQKVLYEIFSYPPGFTQPAGWSTDAAGVYYYLGVSGAPAPQFTLPASTAQYGKFLFRATVNNGQRDIGTGIVNADDLVTEATAVSILSPNGLVGIGNLESTQFGNWSAQLDANFRALEQQIGGGGLTAPSNPAENNLFAYGSGGTLAYGQAQGDVTGPITALVVGALLGVALNAAAFGSPTEGHVLTVSGGEITLAAGGGGSVQDLNGVLAQDPETDGIDIEVTAGDAVNFLGELNIARAGVPLITSGGVGYAKVLGSLGVGAGTLATAGGMRVAHGFELRGRNNADGADALLIGFGAAGTDQLVFGSAEVSTASLVTSGGTAFVTGASLVNFQANGLLTTGYVSIGASPAAVGSLRLAHGGSIYARNQADDNDARLLQYHAANVLALGADTIVATLELRSATNFGAYLGGTQVASLAKAAGDFVAFGTSPPATGAVRLTNGLFVKSKTTPLNEDLALIGLNASNQLQVGENAASFVDMRFQTATGGQWRFMDGPTVRFQMIGGELVVGRSLTTETASVDIGQARTGDGIAHVDLQASPGDFDARILRNAGVNGSLNIRNDGTGVMAFQTVDGTTRWNILGSSVLGGAVGDLVANANGVYNICTFSNRARAVYSNRIVSGDPGADVVASYPIGAILSASVTTVATRGLTLAQNNTDVHAASLKMLKSRGTGLAPDIVGSSDDVAEIVFSAWDGVAYLASSELRAYIDGTPDGDFIPIAIAIATSEDGTPVDRIVFHANGNIDAYPGTARDMVVHLTAQESGAEFRIEGGAGPTEIMRAQYSTGSGAEWGVFGTFSAQQVGLVALTDSTGGAAPNNDVAAVSGTVADGVINGNFRELLEKVNQIRTILNTFGFTTTV